MLLSQGHRKPFHQFLITPLQIDTNWVSIDLFQLITPLATTKILKNSPLFARKQKINGTCPRSAEDVSVEWPHEITSSKGPKLRSCRCNRLQK